MSLLRTRWAAIGAAVAITLGAGGIGIVSATVSSGERAVFIAITPCRLADTRPDFQVGPKSTPLGAEATHTVSAHGTNGECTGIPTDAVALSLNVTALDATAPTFLTIWATGATRPNSSSLNPSPGAPPIPNAVTTELSNSGQFDIFNKQGTVNVIVDINGYYADHNHDDRYVRIPTEEIVLNTFDAWPAPTATGWTWSLAWSHTATGSQECLLLPAEIPPGATITGIELTHLTTAAFEANVQIVGIKNNAGPTASFTHALSTGTFATPASGSSSAATVVRTFAGDLDARPDFNYTAAVCTADAMAVTGLRITLD
jgi:hypothetical protein